MSEIDDIIGTMDSPTIFGGFNWATLEAQAMSELESQRRFEVDEKFRQENIEALRAFQRGDVDISETPGYKFREGRVEKALSRKASARRYYMSPRADKEMASELGGFASQEYANEFLRRFKMAYTPNWARSGGSPNPPTLMSMADKYRGFGGETSGAQLPAPGITGGGSAEGIQMGGPAKSGFDREAWETAGRPRDIDYGSPDRLAAQKEKQDRIKAMGGFKPATTVGGMR